LLKEGEPLPARVVTAQPLGEGEEEGVAVGVGETGTEAVGERVGEAPLLREAEGVAVGDAGPHAIWRSLLLELSAMSTVPATSDTPRGALKRATMESPSVVPGEPASPARVATAPLAKFNRRTTWLPASVMYAEEGAVVLSATPMGEKKEAPAATPSTDTGDPEPAAVVTSPLATATTRRRWLEVSATSREASAGTHAMPAGALKAAAAPTPFAKEAAPEPASVLTTWVDTTMARILWLEVSATYTLVDEESTATAEGLENVADVPAASVDPKAPLPASVITEPPGMLTVRMRWLPVSATYTNSASMAQPEGELKRAFVPMPSAHVADAVPASVVTTEPPATARMRWLLLSATYSVPPPPAPHTA
jgi:hypothetical protein